MGTFSKDKKSDPKKAAKSFQKKDFKPKPKSLEALKKNITGQGFKKDFKQGEGRGDNKKKFFKTKKDFKKGDGEKGPKKDFKKGGDGKPKQFAGKKDFKKGDNKKSSDKKDFQKKKAEEGPSSKAVQKNNGLNYSHKPYARLVEQMKVHWNRLREHSTPADIKNNIVKEMVKQMQAHVMDVTLRHDASRIVQAILQFGNTAQQDGIIAELQAKLSDVSKTPYGHFVVLKAINYCTEKPQMKKITQGLQGLFVSLGTHVIGARVVETILQLYPTQVTRSLKAEFYGKKFTILMAEPPKNLRELIAALPNKTNAILDHMRDLTLKLIQKNLISFVYAHHLLWEYVQELMLLPASSSTATAAEESEETGADATTNANKGGSKKTRITDLVNALVDSAPKLLSTKPGAKAMAFIITHSTAKDRKRIVKSLKGHVLESLVHESAYLGIIRLLDVVDDTVNVHKSFFDELKATDRVVKYAANGDITGYDDPPWLQICLHHNAHKLVLRLLTPHQRHLESEESAVLDIVSPYSKKDDDLRRREHLVYIKPTLLKICARYAGELVRSRSGSKVLQAVYEQLLPVSLIESLANVYADREVEEKEEQVTAMDVAEDDDEEEDDNEDDGDDDDEEDVDGVLPDEFDAEEGDDGEEEGEEEEGYFQEEEFQELLEESKADKKSVKAATSSKPSSAPATVSKKESTLPIEEDACAHVLLKKLLRFESSYLLQELAKVDQDSKVVRLLRAYLASDAQQHNASNEATVSTIVVDAASEVTVQQGTLVPAGLAQRLLEYLQTSPELLQRYLRCNRGCFALHILFQSPATFALGHSVLSAAIASEQAQIDAHEGGRLLKKLVEASQRVHEEETDNKATKGKGKKVVVAVAPATAPASAKKAEAPASAKKEAPASAKKAAVAEVAPIEEAPGKRVTGKRSRANTEDTIASSVASESESETEGGSKRSTRSTRATRSSVASAAVELPPVPEEEAVEVAAPPKTPATTPGRKKRAVAEEEHPDAEEDTTARRSTRSRAATPAKKK